MCVSYLLKMCVTTNIVENFNKKKFLNASGKEIDILQIYSFASISEFLC